MNVYENVSDHDVSLIDYGTYKPGEKIETENYIFNPNFKLISEGSASQQPAVQAPPVAPPANPPAPNQPFTPPVVPPPAPAPEPQTQPSANLSAEGAK